MATYQQPLLIIQNLVFNTLVFNRPPISPPTVTTSNVQSPAISCMSLIYSISPPSAPQTTEVLPLPRRDRCAVAWILVRTCPRSASLGQMLRTLHVCVDYEDQPSDALHFRFLMLSTFDFTHICHTSIFLVIFDIHNYFQLTRNFLLKFR